MSEKENTSVSCPECGTETEVAVWKTLNTEHDPEAKKAVIDGTLFKFTCPECGNVHMLNYPLLYHDAARNVFIYYVNSEDSAKEVVSSIAEAEKLLKKTNQSDKYTTRIVTSPEELREKALIFDTGLDDRVIEVIKFFYLSSALEERPTLEVAEIYFNVSDGKYFLQFVASTPLITEMDKSLYDQISADLADILKNPKFDSYIVNGDWAYSLLQALDE